MDDARAQVLLDRLLEVRQLRSIRQPFPQDMLIVEVMAELDISYEEVMELREYHSRRLAESRAGVNRSINGD